MSRTAALPVIVVGSALTTLIVVGCTTRSASQSAHGPVTAEVPRSSQASEKPAKLFANWPKPAAALIVSGEQLGFLEPCGCSEGQKGGLARRYDLIEKLKAQGWPLALVDLGGLSNDPNSHGGPEETRIRFGYALKALELMHYSAVG